MCALFEFKFCIHYICLSRKVFHVLHEELTSLSSWLFWLLSYLPSKPKQTLNEYACIQMHLVFFALSCLSPMTSKLKNAQSESCASYDQGYESRIQAAQCMSRAAAAKSGRYKCFWVPFYLSFATNLYLFRVSIVLLLTGPTQNTSHIRRQLLSDSLSLQGLSMLEWME